MIACTCTYALLQTNINRLKLALAPQFITFFYIYIRLICMDYITLVRYLWINVDSWWALSLFKRGLVVGLNPPKMEKGSRLAATKKKKEVHEVLVYVL